MSPRSIGLTKTAAGEVARQGIRVNAVWPDTRNPLARSIAQPGRSGECGPALSVSDPDRPLRDTRRDRQHRPIPVLRPRLGDHRCAIRCRRRAHCYRRCGDPGDAELRLAHIPYLPVAARHHAQARSAERGKARLRAAPTDQAAYRSECPIGVGVITSAPTGDDLIASAKPRSVSRRPDYLGGL